MRLAWSSDLHLNFANLNAWEKWVNSVCEFKPDALLITGDISEATDLTFQLGRIGNEFRVPIHFVLGNHDFYRSSIRSERERVRALCKSTPGPNYLSGSIAVSLTSAWSLIGHDGWGDAIFGDYDASQIRLADFSMIEDLARLPKRVLYERLRELGRDAAETLRLALEPCLRANRNVLVATHVPPFPEACLYDGSPASEDWLPFFCCGAVGQMLIEQAKSFPTSKILVLCGHTHHQARATILKNLHVWTAHASYGEPQVQSLIDVELLSQNWTEWESID